jgi:hypothetical protein
MTDLIYHLREKNDTNSRLVLVPLEIGNGVTEKYMYKGCRDIAGSEIKWKYCDTFALIAQGRSSPPFV